MPTLSDILEKAADAYADGKTDVAFDYYKQAEKMDNNCVEALEWLGELSVQGDKVKEAVQYYNRALKLNPKFAEYANLGYCYYELGEAKKAVEALGRAISMNADDIVSHSNYGKALYDYYVNVSEAGARELAAQWRRDFPNNSDAAFMGAAISGEDVPAIANGDFVRDVFDDFADDFDSKLAELGYVAPRLLAEIASEFSFSAERGGRILDLGCGTGLLGIGLRELYSDSYLGGVDLSSKMLAVAEGRGLYDDLECCEILSYLEGYDSVCFDMILAADVFCYFGDLVGVLRGCGDILVRGGYVIFSVEVFGGEDGEGYNLHESGRYRHGEGYIRGLSGEVGLELVEVRRDILRTEYGVGVEGFLVVMRKN